ncbi:MAG: hypothetical protein CL610_09240 [Anaerolineaceae bacterium]|nr:hypothetical protein [Anaerolineaceae bacterium]
MTDRALDPHRLAWGILLLSFAIFCVLAVTVILAVDYFLFQSPVPVRPTLSIGRETIAVMESTGSSERVGYNGETVTVGTRISSYPQSQATLRFTDPQANDSLIAAITLHNSSVLTLRQASRPRFEWSRNSHLIELGNVSGRLSITVPDTADPNLLINIETAAGAIVNLEGAGRYTVNASADQLSVFNRHGNATFIPPDLRQGHSIPTNGLGTINYADNSVSQKPGYVNLLRDSTFDALEADGSAKTQGWVCSSDPNDSPVGEYDFVPMDDVTVLRFVRGDDATTHGITSCVQSFGQTGAEIRADVYNYLALRATFYVEYQSLNACGFDGSECPLMVRMDYIDQNGEGQHWYHGFYAREADSQSNYRLRCASCIQDHDQISEKAWFTYESPNLLTLLEETPPASIVGLFIYASGHQYDVRLDEVTLTAARLDNPEIVPGDVELAGES